MSWSIDYRVARYLRANKVCHAEGYILTQKQERAWGYVPRQTKELSYVASAPICYHDNPELSIIVWNVAPYDIWVWHHANHHSSSLISRAAVRHRHTHGILWASIFTPRWKQPRLIRIIFHTVRSQQVFIYLFIFGRRLPRAWASSGNLDVCVFLLSLIHPSFLSIRFKWGSVCWVLSMAAHFCSRWPGVLCLFFLSWPASTALRGLCWVHVCLQEEI